MKDTRRKRVSLIYTDTIRAIEGALGNCWTLDRARGVLIGGLSALGCCNIWYYNPGIGTGVLLETILPISFEHKLQAMEIAIQLLPKIQMQQKNAGVQGTRHSLDIYWKAIQNDAENNQLERVINPHGVEATSAFSLPLKSQDGLSCQMIVNGYSSSPSFQWLMGKTGMARAHQTAEIFHRAIRPLIVDGVDRVTACEARTMYWMGMGKTNWEISRIEAISESAVNKRVANAMTKLGAINRAQLVAIAAQLGIPRRPF